MVLWSGFVCLQSGCVPPMWCCVQLLCLPLHSSDTVVTEVVMCFHAMWLHSGCMFMWCVVCCYNGHVKYNIRENPYYHGTHKVVFRYTLLTRWLPRLLCVCMQGSYKVVVCSCALLCAVIMNMSTII